MKSEIDQYVIEKVKEKRISCGLSQADLANELKFANGYIGMVESPKYPHKYNLQHLNMLAKIFKCSPKDFLPDGAL